MSSKTALLLIVFITFLFIRLNNLSEAKFKSAMNASRSLSTNRSKIHIKDEDSFKRNGYSVEGNKILNGYYEAGIIPNLRHQSYIGTKTTTNGKTIDEFEKAKDINNHSISVFRMEDSKKGQRENLKGYYVKSSDPVPWTSRYEYGELTGFIFEPKDLLSRFSLEKKGKSNLYSLQINKKTVDENNHITIHPKRDFENGKMTLNNPQKHGNGELFTQEVQFEIPYGYKIDNIKIESLSHSKKVTLETKAANGDIKEITLEWYIRGGKPKPPTNPMPPAEIATPNPK